MASFIYVVCPGYVRGKFNAKVGSTINMLPYLVVERLLVKRLFLLPGVSDRAKFCSAEQHAPLSLPFFETA